MNWLKKTAAKAKNTTCGCDVEKSLEKRKKAVALRYDVEDAAPTVLAKGAGTLAEKIIEKGEEEDIKIYEDALLVEDLTQLELGEQIPPELYTAVAQVLVFINELDKKHGDIK